jgi:hypothetical protein
MTFRRRFIVVLILAFLALAAYGTASYYSTALVAYVVEQAFLQKLPQGADPAVFHRRMLDLLAAMPERDAKLARLLQMSQFMEKVQRLSPAEVEFLLAGDTSITGQAPD